MHNSFMLRYRLVIHGMVVHDDEYNLINKEMANPIKQIKKYL